VRHANRSHQKLPTDRLLEAREDGPLPRLVGVEGEVEPLDLEA